MALVHEPKSKPRNRLRFSLRTLLVFALLVSAYFAGRAPMMHRAQRAEQERDEYRRLAEQHKQDAMRLQTELSFAKRITVLPRPPSPEVNTRVLIDAGMMIDALEHQQRYLPSPTDMLR